MEGDLNLYDLPVKDLSQNANVIEFADLSKHYQLEGREDSVVALRSVTLTHEIEFKPIKKGEFIMIRGPSGGGKTTLLNLVGTIDSPSSGWLRINGQDIDKSSTDAFLSNLRL